MNKQIKGHKTMVWDAKKRQIVKKGIRIKKTHLIFWSAILASALISWQGYRLNQEMKPLNALGEIKKTEVVNDTKTEEKPLITNPVAKLEVVDTEPVYEFIRLKSKHFDNEKTVYLAVIEACKYHGLDNQNCRNDLMGIAWAEHRDFSNRVGDGGKSLGAFQIHTGYHKTVTAAQANDPYWSAKWTLRRMIYNGYKKNRDVAIMKHNGTPNTAKTKAYLATVNEYIKM